MYWITFNDFYSIMEILVSPLNVFYPWQQEHSSVSAKWAKWAAESFVAEQAQRFL